MKINQRNATEYVATGKGAFSYEPSSLYEQINAAHEAGMSLETYWALPGTRYWANEGELTKSMIVAYYRVRLAVETAQSELQKKRT